MEIDKNTAIVDTDFLLHISEIKKTISEICNILKKIFEEIGIISFMHPLVKENELPNPTAVLTSVFEKNIVLLPTLDEVILTNEEREYYCFLIPEIYNRVFSKDIGLNRENALTFWQRQKSLGEVHAFALCLLRNCGIFLSDDGDSKVIQKNIKAQFLADVKVYNRKELIDMLDANTTLGRSEKRAFSHSISH